LEIIHAQALKAYQDKQIYCWFLGSPKLYSPLKAYQKWVKILILPSKSSKSSIFWSCNLQLNV